MFLKNWVAGCLVLSAAMAVIAQERRIPRSELPAAVAATVDRETKGATIKGFTAERENGQMTYEAETVVNGRTRDIEIAKDGRVNVIEEEVDMTSLPTKVQQALSAKASGGQITKVESLAKMGKLVAYEATMIRNGRHSEFQVGPNGSALAHAE